MRFILAALTTFAIGLMALTFAGTETAFAACTSTSQCSADRVCQKANIFGGKECLELRCNFDGDCPTSRPSCSGGACRCISGDCLNSVASSGTGGTGGSGGGTTGGKLGGVGAKCPTQNIGGVTKPAPCQQGLQCINNTCQKPAT
jgi:hypothetical protein